MIAADPRRETDAALERLKHVDVCAVSDALDKLALSGVPLELEALSIASSVVGEVSTVQLGPADGRPSPRHLCTAAVDAADESTVIVIAHGGRTDVAGWGGVLSAAASARGVRGIIIDGACRDIDQSRELGLPIYGRAAVPVTARGRIIEYDWNVPVTIGGVTVRPGDLVVADGSGVAFIPKNNVDEVLRTAEAIVQKERLMIADVMSGKPVSEVMGSNYENMLGRGSNVV